MSPDAPAAASLRAVLGVACVGYFLVLLDVTIVNVALPQIEASLGADISDLQWVVDGYAIALASLMLAAGTFGDLHGHKRVALAGLALFGLASLACGSAWGAAPLVLFRVFQGVGAALLLPSTLAVITHAFPEPAERARAIGLWAGIGSAALAAGPVVGGVLVETVGWRAVFFVNVPLVMGALAFAARSIGESVERRGRRLDVGGVTLGALALAMATFAFISAGHAGISPLVVATAIGAALAVTGLVAFERRTPHPALPRNLLSDGGFGRANAIAGTMNFVSLGLLLALTLYLQEVQGRSALEAGVTMLPLFLPLSVLAPLTGALVARAGPRLPLIVGSLLAALGVVLLVPLQADSSFLTLLPAMLLWGIGLGVLTPAVVAAAVASAGPHQAGLAAAVNNTARQAGGVIGIAAIGGLVGQPGSRQFIADMHHAAWIGAALFAAAAAVATRVRS